MPFLDVRTLVTLLALVSVLLLVLVHYGLEHEARTPGLRAWAAGLACNCVGMVLVATRDHLPYAFFLLGLGLSHLLPVFQHRALDRTLARGRSSLAWAGGAALAALLLLLAGTWLDWPGETRAVITGLYFVAIGGAAAWRCARAWRALRLRPLLWLGGGFALATVLFGWRIDVALTQGLEGSNSLSPTLLNRLTYLGVTVGLVTTTLAFTLLEMTLLQRRLREAALHDGLTGLLNRRGFEPLVQAALRWRRRSGRPCSLVLFDIDRFKGINDAHGHGVGDAALRHVGELLGRGLRPSDAVARLGGEEFVLLLADTPLDGAEAVAERLRMALETTALALPGGQALTLTASAGVAELDGEGDDWTASFNRADRALYRAKAQGRNRVCVSAAA